jgi:hypothetical protein
MGSDGANAASPTGMGLYCTKFVPFASLFCSFSEFPQVIVFEHGF